MFYNDFELNSVQFDVYKDLMHDLCVTGRIHSLILHLVPHPTLHPTPHPVRDPTLHPHAIQHSERRGVGGWYIGGLWWENQRPGFCAPSWPPATELMTSQIGRLC
jgi:hypothetical protein